MCTAMTLSAPHGALFGRTLDLDQHFGERVALTPRRFDFGFRLTDTPYTGARHPLLGMAAVMDGYPLYADAMNDAGLCMAGLRFAGYAHYAAHAEAGSFNLAPWELIPFVLAYHETVDEVEESLRRVRIVDRPFSDGVPNTPLHWMIADRRGDALVVEATETGVQVYRNSVGVLTNAPPFPCQMAHWRNYVHLTAAHPTNAAGQGASLGVGSVGLPGDYTSSARFVRAAFLGREAERMTAAVPDPVSQFFAVLGAVAPPYGAVMTPEGRPHRTLYTSCADTGAGRYYYKTESSCVVTWVAFSDRGDATEGTRVV